MNQRKSDNITKWNIPYFSYLDIDKISHKSLSDSFDIIKNHLISTFLFLNQKYNQDYLMLNSKSNELIQNKLLLTKLLCNAKYLGKSIDKSEEIFQSNQKLITETSESIKITNNNLKVIEEDIKTFIQILREIETKLTKENLNFIYQHLFETVDEIEVSIMNGVVSILIPTKEASPQNCELFLKEFDILKAKLSEFSGKDVPEGVAMHIFKKIKSNFDKFDPSFTQDQALVKQYNYLLLYAQWAEVACELSMANLALLKEQKRILDEGKNNNSSKREIIQQIVNEYSYSHQYSVKTEFNKLIKNIESIESDKNDKINSLNSNITYFNHLYFNPLNLKLSIDEEEIQELRDAGKNKSMKEITKSNISIAKEFILDRQNNCHLFNCFTKYCK